MSELLIPISWSPLPSDSDLIIEQLWSMRTVLPYGKAQGGQSGFTGSPVIPQPLGNSKSMGIDGSPEAPAAWIVGPQHFIHPMLYVLLVNRKFKHLFQICMFYQETSQFRLELNNIHSLWIVPFTFQERRDRHVRIREFLMIFLNINNKKNKLNTVKINKEVPALIQIIQMC